jgi:hypothetical protein
MSDTFLTFEKFADPELAATISAQLEARGIPSQISNEGPAFDPTFANNNFDPPIHIKLRPADFSKARRTLEHYYQGQLSNMDPDYYLFSFTDAELLDLVKNPDEWGPLDYALAKHLLAEHGAPVSPEQEAAFQQERIETLAKPEKPQWNWIIAGYVGSFVFSIPGLILGYILAYIKKTLPNGEQVYLYSARDRWHGKRILALSAVLFLYWLWTFITRL